MHHQVEIQTVKKVTAKVMDDDSSCGKLVVHAEGVVNAAGFSKPTLKPAEYDEPPSDGIQDFTFLAEPPVGSTAQDQMPIEADVTIELQSWMKGVRVHADINRERVFLPSRECPSAGQLRMAPEAAKESARKPTATA